MQCWLWETYCQHKNNSSHLKGNQRPLILEPFQWTLTGNIDLDYPKLHVQLGKRFSKKEVIESAKRSCPWDIVVRKERQGYNMSPIFLLSFCCLLSFLAKCLSEAQISALGNHFVNILSVWPNPVQKQWKNKEKTVALTQIIFFIQTVYLKDLQSRETLTQVSG